MFVCVIRVLGERSKKIWNRLDVVWAGIELYSVNQYCIIMIMLIYVVINCCCLEFNSWKAKKDTDLSKDFLKKCVRVNKFEKGKKVSNEDKGAQGKLRGCVPFVFCPNLLRTDA